MDFLPQPKHLTHKLKTTHARLFEDIVYDESRWEYQREIQGSYLAHSDVWVYRQRMMFPACMDVVQVESASPILAPAQGRAHHIVSHFDLNMHTCLDQAKPACFLPAATHSCLVQSKGGSGVPLADPLGRSSFCWCGPLL